MSDVKELTKEDREHFLGKFLPFAIESDEDIVRSGYQHFFRRYEATVRSLERERDKLKDCLALDRKTIKRRTKHRDDLRDALGDAESSFELLLDVEAIRVGNSSARTQSIARQSLREVCAALAIPKGGASG